MELPETSLLITFDAIARHRNFRAASEELQLTPSAISHRLKTLESVVGQALVMRTTREVSLTAAGEILLPAARTAIEAIGGALDKLSGPRPTVVTIATTDSVAACWLIDRLPSAIAELTDIEVRILTVAAGIEFDPSLADLAIAYGAPDSWPRGDAVLVSAETISPVCAPSIAARINTLEDLWSFPLLEDTNLFLDWATFATQSGAASTVVDQLEPHATYNHSHLALRAAASGQGIALAGTPLANDAITRGELVAPLPDLTLPTPNGYYLVTSHLRRSPMTELAAATITATLSSIDP